MTVAFWCVFVAAILPYIPFALVRGLDPGNPRLRVRDLAGLPARAHAAHLNAFEAFPPFAAAVVISHLALGANGWTNGLALAFVLFRIGHAGFYLADNQPLRSACFTLGILTVIAIFLHAAF